MTATVKHTEHAQRCWDGKAEGSPGVLMQPAAVCWPRGVRHGAGPAVLTSAVVLATSSSCTAPATVRSFTDSGMLLCWVDRGPAEKPLHHPQTVTSCCRLLPTGSRQDDGSWRGCSSLGRRHKAEDTGARDAVARGRHKCAQEHQRDCGTVSHVYRISYEMIPRRSGRSLGQC